MTRPLTALSAASIALAIPAIAGARTTTGRAVTARAHDHAATHRHCAHTALRPNDHNIGLVRAAVLCLINRERTAHGERPLRPNKRLRRAAQGHSRSMAAGDYFAHTGPRDQTPLARMRAAGYISSSRVGYEVGENIAWGTEQLATPRAIVAAWMASPGHRANILDPRYRETGIGVCPRPPASLAHGQAGAIYTQDFGAIIAP